MVVLMDDEDRENEGDLIIAADKVRPEDINFMARYARGLICLTLTRERCQQLKLTINGRDQCNTVRLQLHRISIEACLSGVTTGISAADQSAKPSRPQWLRMRASGGHHPAGPYLPGDG